MQGWHEICVVTPHCRFHMGDAMAKPKSNGLRIVQRGTSANSARYKESPTTAWARAVAMVAARSHPAAQESEKQLPEDFSASDFDIIRARRLSNQI